MRLGVDSRYDRIKSAFLFLVCLNLFLVHCQLSLVHLALKLQIPINLPLHVKLLLVIMPCNLLLFFLISYEFFDFFSFYLGLYLMVPFHFFILIIPHIFFLLLVHDKISGIKSSLSFPQALKLSFALLILIKRVKVVLLINLILLKLLLPWSIILLVVQVISCIHSLRETLELIFILNLSLYLLLCLGLK